MEIRTDDGIERPLPEMTPFKFVLTEEEGRQVLQILDYGTRQHIECAPKNRESFIGAGKFQIETPNDAVVIWGSSSFRSHKDFNRDKPVIAADAERLLEEVRTALLNWSQSQSSER
jgi:hypothetical protein